MERNDDRADRSLTRKSAILRFYLATHRNRVGGCGSIHDFLRPSEHDRWATEYAYN